MEYQFNNEIIKKMWQDRYQKNGETIVTGKQIGRAHV